ncbi:MAG: O-antigen ligase family protein [Phycisphaeraceae bacterium]
MKHFVFLILLTLAGSVAAPFNPIWGLLLYYSVSILKPQTMWDWSLPVEWPWAKLAAAAAILGVLLNASKLFNRARFSLIVALMFAFLILMTFSTLTAHDPALSQFWLLEYAKVLVMAIIVTLLVERMWHIRALGAVVLVCIGYIGWEANYRYFFDGRMDIYHHGFGDLDNNGAGLMLAMGLPFAYAFAMTASRYWMRIVSVVAGFFILHAMLMTYSRGAMLASIVAVAWLLAHHKPRKQAAAIAAVLALIVAIQAGPEIRERFMLTTQFERDYSAQSRLTSWEAAYEIVKEHPLTGVGIRNSNTYTKNYGADQVGRTIHSQYLQIAADSGIPSLLVYLGLVCASLACMGQARKLVVQKIAQDDPELAWWGRHRLRHMHTVILSCQGSLIVFLFGSVFLSLEVFEMPWMLMGIAAVLPRVVRSEIERMREPVSAEIPEGDDERPATLEPSLAPVPIASGSKSKSKKRKLNRLRSTWILRGKGLPQS